MSEDFDRDAVREELREKYERDQEKRAATQQMSELLLQGATMTNRHCDDCGDPIFRMNDREFCATCDADADSESERSGVADQDGAASAAADDTASTDDAAPEEAASSSASDPGTGFGRRSASPTPGGSDRSPDQPAATAEADLVACREALANALTQHARLATETNDPRRASDHLAAAREAAEALAALR